MPGNGVRETAAAFMDRVARGTLLLVGEVHGTAESPVFVLSLVRHALSRGLRVGIALELPVGDAPALQEFLASDGSRDAADALVTGEVWQYDDGRGSLAMLEFLDELRRLRQSGAWLAVQPFVPMRVVDRAEDQNDVDKWESELARELLAFAEMASDGVVIALCGNFHAATDHVEGLPTPIRPMGAWCRTQHPQVIALNVVHAGGSAWCRTYSGPGPHDLAGVDLGGEQFIEMAPDLTPSDGRYYLGTVTASPPARMSRR